MTKNSIVSCGICCPVCAKTSKIVYVKIGKSYHGTYNCKCGAVLKISQTPSENLSK